MLSMAFQAWKSQRFNSRTFLGLYKPRKDKINLKGQAESLEVEKVSNICKFKISQHVSQLYNCCKLQKLFNNYQTTTTSI